LKRSKEGGGFGGISHLEKKRQYRAKDAETEARNSKADGYGMVFDKGVRHDRPSERERDRSFKRDARSRSPRRPDLYREPPSRHERLDRGHRDDRGSYQRDRY